MSEGKVRCVHKIIKHNDKYVVFYNTWCSFSKKALEKIKESKEPYRLYDIDSVKDGMATILQSLNKGVDKINFNSNHTTSPIIFYKGKYVGGYSDLTI
jgi:glutaredoxin